ncbi:hypothetical protein HPB52_018274 [Rhipicephalus sanguineus]|uniref:Secreted protein n=1 Tax=Rhipicephalus sanguineus TaxID=34632 RepID=A0A9D4PK75_RHISA|nr:hypothetical protein HPB52_018274 [Rhipicephalus sanguineus]
MRTSDNPFVFLVQFFLGLLLASSEGSLRSGESTTAQTHSFFLGLLLASSEGSLRSRESTTAQTHSVAYYHAPTIPSCTSSEMLPHHSPLPIPILTAHDQHQAPPTSSPTKARAAHWTLLGHGGTSGMRTSDNQFVFLVQSEGASAAPRAARSSLKCARPKSGVSAARRQSRHF